MFSDWPRSYKLSVVSLVLLIPPVFFWLNVVLFLLFKVRVLLDVLFSNLIVGYVVTLVCPTLAALLAVFTYRTTRSRLSKIALTGAISCLLILLLAAGRTY